jgi:hypothetical protein
MAESKGPPDGPYYALVEKDAAKTVSLVLAVDPDHPSNIWRLAPTDPTTWKMFPQLVEYFDGTGGVTDADPVPISRAEADRLVTSWGGKLPS